MTQTTNRLAGGQRRDKQPKLQPPGRTLQPLVKLIWAVGSAGGVATGRQAGCLSFAPLPQRFSFYFPHPFPLPLLISKANGSVFRDFGQSGSFNEPHDFNALHRSLFLSLTRSLFHSLSLTLSLPVSLASGLVIKLVKAALPDANLVEMFELSLLFFFLHTLAVGILLL